MELRTAFLLSGDQCHRCIVSHKVIQLDVYYESVCFYLFYNPKLHLLIRNIETLHVLTNMQRSPKVITMFVLTNIVNQLEGFTTKGFRKLCSKFPKTHFVMR